MTSKVPQNQATLAALHAPIAGCGRRSGALLYDLLLLLAVWWLAALPFVMALDSVADGFWKRTGFQLYLLTVAFAYYTGFWVQGGQTLGLRAWKLKIVAADGGPVTRMLAIKRFAASLLSYGCFGLGFVWMLADPEKLAWHDRLSGTRPIGLDLSASNSPAPQEP